MKRSLHIATEMKEISPLIAEIPFVPIYTIPNDYFKELHSQILLKVHKSDTYHVPDGYFDQLSSVVLAKIQLTEQAEEENELASIAPVLSAIPKKNVYAIPGGYFDNLSFENKQEAKIVSLTAVKKSRFVWVKYAVAACAVGIISLFALNFFSTKAVAKEDQVIAGTNLTYKQIKNINVDTELEKVSAAEMDTYLCDNGLVACNNEKDNTEIEKELENLNISDEELDALLDETKN